MIETHIWLALKSGVESLPFGYPVAWPAEKFIPTLKPYLRVGRANAAPRRVLIAPGKPHDRQGFLIVTLVYPLGQAAVVYENLAAQIAAHFKDGTQLRSGSVCLTVPDYPQVLEGYEDTGYWNVPVRIPWKCYA